MGIAAFGRNSCRMNLRSVIRTATLQYGEEILSLRSGLLLSCCMMSNPDDMVNIEINLSNNDKYLLQIDSVHGMVISTRLEQGA